MTSEPDPTDVSTITSEVEAALVELGVSRPKSEARAFIELAVRNSGYRSGPHLNQTLQRMLSERRLHRSVARIAGVMRFYGLELKVIDGVYEPCTSSERLVDYAVDWVRNQSRDAVRALDIGTGSGNVLLALASSVPRVHGLGVDIDALAVDLARENARTHRLSSRCSFTEGDVHQLGLAGFDLVLSTLPWLSGAAIQGLMPEARLHDPIKALDGGRDGLAHFRQLASYLDRLLRPDGVAFIQVGYEVVHRAQRVLSRPHRQTTVLRDGYGFPMGLAVTARQADGL